MIQVNFQKNLASTEESSSQHTLAALFTGSAPPSPFSSPSPVQTHHSRIPVCSFPRMIPPSASRFLGALLCLSYAVSLGGCKRLQRCPPALTEPPPEEGCVEYHPIHGQGVDEEFHKWIQYRLWPLFDRYLGTKYWGNSNEWFRESFVRMFNWLGDPPHPFEFMYSVGDEAPSIYDPTPFHSIISVPDPDWVGPTRPTSRLDERFYLADCQWNNGGEIWRQWSEMIVGRFFCLLPPRFVDTGS